ncbi:MAG: hypothetical protein JEZ07_03450 [Phycisphaerae bacterium]|nr:hypothetical protein [Phycisphaerae bacterium]
MLNLEINTIDDVKRFFTYLVQEKHLNFHPDTDFNEYLDSDTDKALFSAKEAKQMNILMNNSFIVCQKCNCDIFQYGIEALISK